MTAAAEPLWQRAVRLGWYPAVLFGSVGLAYALIANGTDPGVVVASISVALIPISLGMELLCPETPRWRLERGEVFTDFLHMMVSNPIPTWILRGVLFGALVGLSDRISGAVGFALWPVHWPLAAQALLAWTIAELANYGIHRGMHRSRLWPLHAVHHCSPRMYCFLSVRKHPLQSFVTYGGRLSVLWLLGVTEQALGVYTVLISANSYLQHSNIRMTTGPLGLVFATPELHRLHHSSRPDLLDNNYGDSMILWDRLFGTCREPDSAPPIHDAIGLPGIEIPQTYAAHLRLPFAWSRLHDEADGATPPPAAMDGHR